MYWRVPHDGKPHRASSKHVCFPAGGSVHTGIATCAHTHTHTRTHPHRHTHTHAHTRTHLHAHLNDRLISSAQFLNLSFLLDCQWHDSINLRGEIVNIIAEVHDRQFCESGAQKITASMILCKYSHGRVWGHPQLAHVHKSLYARKLPRPRIELGTFRSSV